MKKLLVLLIPAIAFTSRAQELYPCPPNGNAESNNFTNWATLMSESQNPQVLNDFAPGFDVDRFAIHDNAANFGPGLTDMLVNGVDQYGLFSVPSQGTYCFSLGNNVTGGQAQLMRYTFTVTNQNKHFKFRYAVVLEDGGHSGGENPAVWFYMVKGTNHVPGMSSMSLFSNTFQELIADLNDPFFKRSATNQDVIYKDWECVEYDLSSYVGQQVSLVAISRDCAPTAHFGYLYLDGLCNAWPAVANGSLSSETICLEQDIFLNAASSEGEDSYFLEVSEVDGNGNPIPGGMVVSNWFIGAQAPDNINIKNYLAAHDKTLECGKRYKVKIAVVNRCAPWHEKSLYFSVNCPSANAGPDITECCQGEVVQTDGWLIGPSPVTGNVYSWTSVPAGLTSSNAQVMVQPTNSTAYLLTVNLPNGCIARDTVIARFLPEGYALALTTDYKLCDNQAYVTAHLAYQGCPMLEPDFLAAFGYPDASFIQWSFQPEGGVSQFLGTGGTIRPPNLDGILTATITSQCLLPQTATATIPIHYRPAGHGLIAPNTFIPDGDGVNDTFRILEYGNYAPENIGDGPAYDAVDFRLRVWNRWGTNFKTTTKADAGRGPDDYLRQGDILWDGTDNGGAIQDGVFNYTLEMKYCGQEEFERVCMDGMETDPCIKWVWFFCTLRLEGCAKQLNVLH